MMLWVCASLLLSTISLTFAQDTVSPEASNLAGYQWKQTFLSGNYILHWFADVNNTLMHLALQANTIGWVGFGLGEPTSGSMPGGDIVQGYVDDVNGSVHIVDRYAIAKSTPLEDSCQDWIVVGGYQVEGWTTLNVQRNFNTGDILNDRPFASGLTRIITAFGQSDTFSYHFTNREGGAITFFGEAPILGADLPDINGSYTYTFNSYPVPPNASVYACQSFTVPNLTAHVINFQTVVSSNYLHHMLVHSCNYDPNTGPSLFWRQYQTPGVCISPVGVPTSGCISTIFAWALGSGELNTPPEAGFLIGTGAIRYIIIEIHYANPQLLANLVDTSGVIMRYTTILRQFNAGVLMVGQPFPDQSEQLPYPDTNTTREFSCPSSCTAGYIGTHNSGAPLHVFSSFMHMHVLGAEMYTRLLNTSALPSIINRIEYWDFGYQHQIEVDFLLHAGDRLNTHCYWNTVGATVTPVLLGPATTQEMCMNFLSYYPLINNFSLCGNIPADQTPGKNQTDFFICGNQPAVGPTYPANDTFFPDEEPAVRIFGQLDNRTAAQCPLSSPTIDIADVNACVDNPCPANFTCEDIVAGPNDDTGRICLANVQLLVWNLPKLLDQNNYYALPSNLNRTNNVIVLQIETGIPHFGSFNLYSQPTGGSLGFMQSVNGSGNSSLIFHLSWGIKRIGTYKILVNVSSDANHTAGSLQFNLIFHFFPLSGRYLLPLPQGVKGKNVIFYHTEYTTIYPTFSPAKQTAPAAFNGWTSFRQSILQCNYAQVLDANPPVAREFYEYTGVPLISPKVKNPGAQYQAGVTKFAILFKSVTAAEKGKQLKIQPETGSNRNSQAQVFGTYCLSTDKFGGIR